METEEKRLMRRCPRLGGPVSFFYCKTCEQARHPCWKIIDCWWETFDVVRYLRDTLSPELFESLATRRPKPKITQLVDIIAQSKKRLAQP